MTIKNHLELPKPEIRSTFLSSPSASSLLQTSARSWYDNEGNSNHLIFLMKQKLFFKCLSEQNWTKWNTSFVRPVGCLFMFLCPLDGEWTMWINWPFTCICKLFLFLGNYTHRAAINASCSAALTAAISSSLVKGAPPFLSLAYHVRSLPFCHRPTGAIKEFPGNNTESVWERWKIVMEGDEIWWYVGLGDVIICTVIW